MAEKEEKLDIESQKVGDLSVGELISILRAVLDAKRAAGDPRLIDMTVKEFTTFTLEQLRTRAYQTATVETDVAERILTDWQGLKSVGAVTQPFRIRNADEARKFGEETAEFYRTGGRAEMVVAVAICNPDGTYVKR